MTTLTEKFAAFEQQVEAQDAAMQVDLNAIREALGLLNDQIDVLNVNAAANTRAILAALGANSPCAPCPTPPIFIPPVDDTTRPVDTDKCKRTQAFLHFMTEAFTVLDVASSVGIAFNPTLISDAINQVIEAVANGDTTPVISFPEAVQLGGDLINYVAFNLLRGDTLVGDFTPLVLDLRDAIYPAGDAAADKAAYDGVIDASSLDSDVKTVLKDTAYSAIWSYYFDPASDPNLTGYDGSVCAPEGACVVITSPIDAGTSQYDYGGNHYQRVDKTGIDIYARLLGTTTIQCPVALTISSGAFVGYVAADELISFDDMTTRIGISPRYFDTSNPSEENQIEFCGLAPEE